MKDAVRPDSTAIKAVRERSRNLWSSYAHDTDSGPPAVLCLRSLLGRVPAFHPSLLQEQQSLAFKYHHVGSALQVSGSSVWRTLSQGCHLPTKTLHHKLSCGFVNPLVCSLAEESAPDGWPVFQDDTQGSHVTFLILAWAYILSARWAELQRPASRLIYTFQRAGLLLKEENIPPGVVGIDIGEASGQAIRWWAALLASGQGWLAEIASEAKVYQSPWSTCIPGNHRLMIRTSDNGYIANPGCIEESPPSSLQALIYLQEYCELHAIGNQYTPALAAALFLPWKNSEGASVVLPLPTPRSSIVQGPSPGGSTSEGSIESQSQQLPYYMTLSCNVRGLKALLSGSFFDPAIPCHLVGPWIQPIFDIIDPLIAREDLKSFAKMIGRKQPILTALWLGAIIVRLEKSILQSVRNGLYSIEPHIAAWTGTVHSFIDVPQHKRDTISQAIDRADECQLLYLTGSESHQRFPASPWRPFGTTPLIYTDIEVQKHATCTGGHQIQYVSWRWNIDGGCSCEDFGFSQKSAQQDMIPSKLDLVSPYEIENWSGNELASEIATRSVFRWLRVDGYPPTEKSIFTHDWFVGVESSSEESESDNDGTPTTDLSTIEAWLDDLE
ncbi:MAG: hypothetical protein Q9209_007163 [Squamulea sp. 1 TL-2023]